jgi:hypothetical protein
LALSSLSVVALGVLLAAVTPPHWLTAGIVAMAAVDAAVVIADLLQKPNDALNAAHPAAGLPRLQNAQLGSAVMGYGDLFIAGALGALLVLAFGRELQARAALLAAALALGFDLLFFFVDELPATVPVALTLIVVLVSRPRRSELMVPTPAPAVSARTAPPRASPEQPRPQAPPQAGQTPPRPAAP